MNKHPVRILNLFTVMNRGGAETMCMNLYRNLDRSKIQFDFLVYHSEKGGYDDEIELLGGKIHRMAHLKCLPAHLHDAKLFFAEHPEYNIVHNHMGENGAWICQAARKAGVKTVIYHSHAQHEPLFDKRPQVCIRRLFNCCMYQIAKRYCTDYFACGQEAADFFDKKVSNIHILHNAVDLNRFAFNPEIRKKKREELHCSGNFVIGNVARLDSNKNQLFLLETFRKILQNQPNAQLWLVGDGCMVQTVREHVTRYQLDGKVILWGIRNDVHEMLQAMDVFVFPSVREGLSVACIEAQTAGLPCVFSDGFDPATAITENCRILSLAAPVEKWAGTILEFKNFERKDTTGIIQATGYDIKETAKMMENYYLSCMERE